MVWSPPIATRRLPPAVRLCAEVWIWSTASLMLKGFTEMSPASATCWVANGSMSCAGLYGRSSRDASRTCAGPNRAPGR